MEPVVKHQLRAEFVAARGRVPADVHAAEARALCAHVRKAVNGAQTVAAYVPVGSEPGSIELLDVLLTLCPRVLLPVARTDAERIPLPLRWGEYRSGELKPAPLGLLEPPEPWLEPTALAEAGVLLVPALAVDRRGVRLGRGAGFYDRSLRLRDPSARTVAVVRDDEVVAHLPAEPHDVPMTHALTPVAGLVELCDTA